MTLLCIAGLLTACGNDTAEKTETYQIEPNHAINYPVTRKGDLVEQYFGSEVADPYRWLEDDRSCTIGYC